MQLEVEAHLPQMVSELDPNFLNHLRLEKRNAAPHLKLMSSMTTKNNFKRISFQRRNAIRDPLAIYIYMMNEVADANDTILF